MQVSLLLSYLQAHVPGGTEPAQASRSENISKTAGINPDERQGVWFAGRINMRQASNDPESFNVCLHPWDGNPDHFQPWALQSLHQQQKL